MAVLASVVNATVTNFEGNCLRLRWGKQNSVSLVFSQEQLGIIVEAYLGEERDAYMLVDKQVKIALPPIGGGEVYLLLPEPELSVG